MEPPDLIIQHHISPTGSFIFLAAVKNMKNPHNHVLAIVSDLSFSTEVGKLR